MHFSVIKNVNFFHVIRRNIRKNSIVCSVIVPSKDCSNCALPHNPDNYGYITGKYQEIMEIVKQNADLKEEK